MRTLPFQLFDRAELRAWLGLSLLLLLLSLGAVIPRLGVHFRIADLPGAGTGEAPLIALVAAIVIVACLGVSVIYLLSRCRALELARGVDNHAALHDPLTGTANRRHFEQCLEQMIAEEKPAHALMMIDLDRFKPVNDLYGHAAGDALLQEIAVGLGRIVGPNDLVARLGGDEFAFLLSHTTSDAAEKTALSVLEFVTKYRLNWQGQRISVGTSIGLVDIDRNGLTPAALLAAADEALYAAKEAGRGAVFTAELNSDPTDKPKVRRIDAGTPEPVSSASSHEPEDGRRQELYGAVMATMSSDEATDKQCRQGSRRRHEIAHWVAVEPLTIGDAASPGMLMRELIEDAATRSDGGADFARWVLIMALDIASRLTPTALGRIGFVLPLPARAVVAVPELADELMRINSLAHKPIRHLCFVLHNITSVYDSPAIEQFHHRLNTNGVRLGFEIRSGTLDVLAPLRHVAYDELHLGRELIKNLRPGTSGNAAVEALLTVAEQSGTTLVASSVDTADEVRHLAMMGVNRFGGPVVGKPEPLHNVLQHLSNSI